MWLFYLARFVSTLRKIDQMRDQGHAGSTMIIHHLLEYREVVSSTTKNACVQEPLVGIAIEAPFMAERDE